VAVSEIVNHGHTVDEVLDLYRKGGDERYFGEAISQTEHALQSAWLAEKAGASPAIIGAALLHDVGHLLHGMGDDIADEDIDARHEAVGAAFLAQRFNTELVAAVSLHVLAKRYLVGTDPAYAENLSPASVHSLELQGGPMGVAEAAEFMQKKSAAGAIALRRWDDEAKVVGLKTPDLDHFRPYLEASLRR
jgi:[1-hydroxy-2-(trimethylamino)ethyl]phosphonate dioxygenase